MSHDHFGDRLRWSGQFGFSINGGEYIWTPNRVVDQGLNYFLNAGLRAEGAQANWYVAPFAANVTPAASLTAATFASTLTEFTNYAEANRVQWVSDGAASSLVIENNSAPALFTIGNGVQTTIYGAGLLSSSPKSSTAGVLVAAAKLPTGLTGLADGFEVRLKYRITAASA